MLFLPLALAAALLPNAGAAPPQDKPADTPQPPPAAVEEVGPEIYYLPDEAGKLRPVPGWTLEEFRRLVQQKGTDEQAPAFSLQRLAARGNVIGDQAQLTVEVTAKLAPKRPDQWIRVPLKMAGALLSEPARTNRGNLMLEYQDAGDGYVAWLRGTGEEPVVLSFQMLLPLKSGGGQQTLVWNLPRVAPSQLQLQIPLRSVVAEVAAGGVLQPAAAVQDKSELTVLGLGGDLRMSWHAPDQRTSSGTAMLEAEGAHLVRIQRGSIRTQAQLAIRSLGAPMERLRIKLPRGARLVSQGATSGYKIIAVDADASRGDARPVAEVQVEKKSSGPVNLQFVCEQPFDLANANPLEFGTFEVEGAVRHWGNVGVEVEGDWQLLWGNMKNVRRIENVPAALAGRELAAAFEYSGQPYLLSARVTPPSTRVSVEPEYSVSVMADDDPNMARLQLDARLKYLVSGAKIFELSIDLSGWELADGSLAPASRVDVSRVAPATPGPLKIPLTAALKGEFEITLRAHRRVPLANGLLSSPLPKPVANTLAPATLVIVPDDNVQLAPRRDAMAGLTALPILTSIDLPPRTQTPSFFRVENPAARLAADFQVRGREVTVAVASRVRLTDRQASVRQTLDFNIAYEAIPWLAIRVPRTLAEAGAIKATLEGEAITPLDAGIKPADGANGEIVEQRLPLRKPRIGPARLQLDYQVPFSGTATKSNVQVSLPLVMPAEATVRDNQLILEPAAGVTAELTDARWSPVDEARGNSRDDLGRRYQVKGAAAQAALVVRLSERSTGGDVVIHRGWVQSWCTGDARHDQAAYQVSSREENLAIELPPGTRMDAVEVWLNGQPAAPEFDAAGALRVKLPTAGSSPHRLMLRYLVPGENRQGSRVLTLPKFAAGTWVQKLYWQLVLPPDEHMLSAPSLSTAEYVWRRQGLIWERQSLLDERELAEWVGIPETETAAPAGAQRYLVSLSATGQPHRFTVMPRALLVLIAAGATLCAGLVWINFQGLRRPAVLLVAAVALLALALLYSELAIVLGQAAALGLGLVVLVALLRRWLGTSRGSAVIVRGGNSNVSMSSTEFVYQPKADSSGSSERTIELPATVGSGSKRSGASIR